MVNHGGGRERASSMEQLRVYLGDAKCPETPHHSYWFELWKLEEVFERIKLVWAQILVMRIKPQIYDMFSLQ